MTTRWRWLPENELNHRTLIRWGDNRLEAMIAGARHKARLGAKQALNDDPQAASERYLIPLTTIYGAVAFHYYNESAIQKAMREARAIGEQLDARSEH